MSESLIENKTDIFSEESAAQFANRLRNIADRLRSFSVDASEGDLMDTHIPSLLREAAERICPL